MRQELRKGKSPALCVNPHNGRLTNFIDPPVLDVSEIETNRDLGE